MGLYGNTLLNVASTLKIENIEGWECINLKIPECEESYIRLYNTGVESNNEIINIIEKNFKVLKSKYKSIINEVFDSYVKSANDNYNMNVKNGKQLQNMTSLSHVIYVVQNNNCCTFEFLYNDGVNIFLYINFFYIIL